MLDLSANSLEIIPTNQLEILERLENLSLGRNPFSQVGDTAFRGLNKLRVLDLSESFKLRTVSRLAFHANTHLSSLSLSGCRNLQLPAGCFFALSELKSLHLSDLGWSYVAKDLAHWHNINLLDLSYNPLVCDCEAAWLREILTNKSRAVCHHPVQHEGKLVKNLLSSELRCDDSFREEQTVIAVLCVIAGLLTALVIVSAVHCHKRLRNLIRCDNFKKSENEELRTEEGMDNLYYRDRAIPSLHEKLNQLYYPSSTKSTLCEEDYFLSLSKDRTTFKPIRVCEL